MADLWKQLQRATRLLETVQTACEEGLSLLDELAHVAVTGGDGLAMADRAWADVIEKWESWRTQTVLQEVPQEFGGRYCKGVYLIPLGHAPLRLQLPPLLPHSATWPRAEYVADIEAGLTRTLDSLRLLSIQVETARQEAEQLV